MTKLLLKANDELISWCKCEDEAYAVVGQADCPWCGCGWLFSCIGCRKSFSFAKVVRSELSLAAFFARDRSRFYKKPIPLNDEDVLVRAEWLENELRDIPVGEICAILDGKILPVKSINISYNGWFARHQLLEVPQWAYRHTRADIDILLGNPQYWTNRKLPENIET